MIKMTFVLVTLLLGTPALGAERTRRAETAAIVETKPRLYHVDRAAVRAELGPRASLLSAITHSARVVPELRDGKATGVRLYSVRPDGWAGRLGFQNGDRLLSVNQHSLTSPEEALQAYAALSSAERLDVRLERGGQEMALTYLLR